MSLPYPVLCTLIQVLVIATRFTALLWRSFATRKMAGLISSELSGEQVAARHTKELCWEVAFARHRSIVGRDRQGSLATSTSALAAAGASVTRMAPAQSRANGSAIGVSTPVFLRQLFLLHSQLI